MATYDPEIELMSGLFDAPPREALKAARTPVPTLPTDDPLFQLEPRTHDADALCERLETEQLCGDVLDLKPEEVRKIITPLTSEPLTLNKTMEISKRAQELNARLERLISTEVRNVLIPIKATILVEERKADLAKGDGARRATITKMLRPLRSLFREITPLREKQFTKLTDAMAAFVTDRIIDEA
jgi:hypothetical protein